jgi:hypothetical protein
VELLWRLARVTCEKAKLAGRNNNDTKRKELMYNALEYINRAMKCEPEKGCAPAHKWYNYVSTQNSFIHIGMQSSSIILVKSKVQMHD